MDEYLKLNDETVLKDSRAIESQYGLFVYINDPDYDIIKAFALLSDKAATQRITFYYYKAELVFDGYTKIVSIQSEGERIIAMLTKEKDVKVNHIDGKDGVTDGE